MIVQSTEAEEFRAAHRQNEKPLGTRDNVKPDLSSPGTVTTTPKQRKAHRKAGGSRLSAAASRGAQMEEPKLPLAREKNFSEYQDNYKAWPVVSVRRRSPMDCIRLKGYIDLVTNYADVYKGAKGKVAKLVRHQDTVGSDPCRFKIFSEYQDTFKAWSVLPVGSHKPVEYRARGDLEFVTNYAQEYKAWKIERRLPIIHLEQTAMPVGPFQNLTSYRHDFAPKTPEDVPSSRQPTRGQTQLLVKRRQISRSSSAKESRQSRDTDP